MRPSAGFAWSGGLRWVLNGRFSAAWFFSLGTSAKVADPFADLGLENDPRWRRALIAPAWCVLRVGERGFHPSDRHDLIAGHAHSPMM